MTSGADPIYRFVFRGLLAEQALDRAGRDRPQDADTPEAEIAAALSLDLLDTEAVSSAKRMSIVYTAIAAFENSSRQLIKGALAEKFGADWWGGQVPEAVRKKVQDRINEEENARWHTPRGGDQINYADFKDLLSIIKRNWDVFEPHLHQQDWVANIFDVLERSRNVIMHSGVLDRTDIERIGIYLRDWVRQVSS